jgi:hypothetical protein
VGRVARAGQVLDGVGAVQPAASSRPMAVAAALPPVRPVHARDHRQRGADPATVGLDPRQPTACRVLDPPRAVREVAGTGRPGRLLVEGPERPRLACASRRADPREQRPSPADLEPRRSGWCGRRARLQRLHRRRLLGHVRRPGRRGQPRGHRRAHPPPVRRPTEPAPRACRVRDRPPGSQPHQARRPPRRPRPRPQPPVSVPGDKTAPRPGDRVPTTAGAAPRPHPGSARPAHAAPGRGAPPHPPASALVPPPWPPAGPPPLTPAPAPPTPALAPDSPARRAPPHSR